MPDHEQLPDSVTSLICLARVAHTSGDRRLERAALDKLAREYGIRLEFVCVESAERDMERGKGASNG